MEKAKIFVAKPKKKRSNIQVRAHLQDCVCTQTHIYRLSHTHYMPTQLIHPHAHIYPNSNARMHTHTPVHSHLQAQQSVLGGTITNLAMTVSSANLSQVSSPSPRLQAGFVVPDIWVVSTPPCFLHHWTTWSKGRGKWSLQQCCQDIRTLFRTPKPQLALPVETRR